MKRYEITLTLTTPCISSGGNVVDKTQRNADGDPYPIRAAEFRAPSIRGALRYWFRALGGSKRHEKEIFGGIGTCPEECLASKIIVRVIAPPKKYTQNKPEEISITTQDYFLGIWNGSEQKSYFENGQTARIQIIDKSESPEFEKALKAFLYLGSIGSRSRRTYGSIYPKSISCNNVRWSIPETLDEFKEYLKTSGLKNAVVLKINPPHQKRSKQEPTLENAIEHAQAYLKTHRSKYNSTPEERVVLGLPFAGFFICDEKKEAHDQNSRWASPLHLKILEFDKKFIPIAIFLKDHFIPEGTKISQIISDEKMPKAKSPVPTKLSHALINKMMADGECLWATP